MATQKWQGIDHNKLNKLMKRASGVALERYRSRNYAVSKKEDGSPVTSVDEELHRLFLAELPGILDFPVVSEEGPWRDQSGLKSFWCVDPLDGTRHFIADSRDFALCVALVWEGFPVLGALEAPAWGQSFYAYKGGGAFLNQQRLPVSGPTPGSGVTVLTSSQPSPRLMSLMDQMGWAHHEKMGSVIKLARLAQGEGHIYPRWGSTYEWDTASGQIILEEMGGAVVDLMGFERLSYGKDEYLNRGFLAWSQGALSRDSLEKFKDLVGSK